MDSSKNQKSCIFLVDDNVVNLNTGKAALHHKYTVITIPSGEMLLRALEKTKPDLVLLDIDMPGMSGFDTIKVMKRDPETVDIPVIFLTGKDGTENELLGLSLDAVDYITKPFAAPLLLKRVELHLELHAQKNELRRFNEKLLDTVQEKVQDLNSLHNAIIGWAAEVIEFRDEETGYHVERVQKYLEVLVNAMGKTEKYAAEVATWDKDAFLRSALLHDVGKIKVHDDILLKREKLTEEELMCMQLHPIYGKTLLESLQNKLPDQAVLEYAKTLAYSHHERWDGTGYPNRLEGEEIHLQARMMSLADVYDALISERPYKRAFSHEEAMTMIVEQRGTQFDPELADLFVSLSDQIEEISKELNAVKLGIAKHNPVRLSTTTLNAGELNAGELDVI
ncbi:MAG: response regulator [Coriobacteriales bacterium]|jgi:putative two-component system response regulator|nr:response regulator [Coriobacteriales bacterium]